MHVLEPKELTKRREDRVGQKRRHSHIVRGLVVLLLLSGSILAWRVLDGIKPAPAQQQQLSHVNTETSPPTKAKTRLKTFKGDEFRDLYRSVDYPNTQTFSELPDITGNQAADARIRKLAEARGFALTSLPVSPIAKTNEPLLKGAEDDLLQPLALMSWQELKKAAEKAAMPLVLSSAYRSPKWQRDLFMQRLLDQGVNIAQLASGQADAVIKKTLELTAVPGYSRHHTGYTIDVWCEDGSTTFGDSNCYKWLNANNYERAKKFGWIPSYPEDASQQGPEPEPWEYVWVGTDSLYE